MFTRNLIRNEDPAPTDNGGGAGGLYTPPANTVAPDTTVIPIDKPSWDAPNWKELLDEDVRNDPSLKNILDPKNLAKSYVNAQKMIGADKIVLPNKYATEDEWQNIYTKLGRPEAPDKYELAFSEETPISEDFTKNLKESMYKAGLNNAQAKQVADFWQNQVATSTKQLQESEDARINEEISGLKKEWGAAFPSKIKAATEAIRTFGGEEMFKYMDEAGLSTDTKLARFLAKIGESLVEDGTVTDISRDSLITPVDAEKEIADIMSNPAYFDGNHPSHKVLVARASELFRIKNS